MPYGRVLPGGAGVFLAVGRQWLYSLTGLTAVGLRCRCSWCRWDQVHPARLAGRRHILPKSSLRTKPSCDGHAPEIHPDGKIRTRIPRGCFKAAYPDGNHARRGTCRRRQPRRQRPFGWPFLRLSWPLARSARCFSLCGCSWSSSENACVLTSEGCAAGWKTVTLDGFVNFEKMIQSSTRKPGPRRRMRGASRDHRKVWRHVFRSSSSRTRAKS